MLKNSIVDPQLDLLNLANQALEQNNLSQASKYFEHYAESLLNTNRTKAASYFCTAAKYDTTNQSRVLSLYQKAFKIYKQLGKAEDSANLLMEMGLVYIALGKPDVARKEFKIGMTIYLDLIKDQVQGLRGPLNQTTHDYLIAKLDKVKFCLNELYANESRK